MPQHSSREPAKRCSRAHAVDQGFFDSLIAASEEIQERRFLYGRKFGQMTAKGRAVRAALIVCPAGSPLPVTVYANFAIRNSHRGIDAPTPARVVGLPPRGGSTFFRSERKYQRKPAARRLQRRPTSLCAVGFGLREPFGLSSTSARCAHPPGKSPLLPIFERGSSQCRAQTSWRDNSCYRARSCSLLSSFKKGKAFSLRCLSPLCSGAVGVGQAYPLRGGMLSCGLGIFATQKASVKLKSRWPVL